MNVRQSLAIGRKVMKKLKEAVLAMGAVISLAGPAAAQGIYFDLGPGPGRVAVRLPSLPPARFQYVS
jgi:hypothetical protein